MNEIYWPRNELQNKSKKLHYREVLPEDKNQMIIVEFKNKRLASLCGNIHIETGFCGFIIESRHNARWCPGSLCD